ncbi:hypothetical protein QP585_22330 [Serratia ureilytica]|uniref:hypothetical protein n=1 Tax=Serratia ureilytica TaxID=300181 RepID=UPI00254E9B21|nr:hypothetical protein [Serratia ureilytica]MDK7595853.1 hypothetical protein [Serratia ureilytica]
MKVTDHEILSVIWLTVLRRLPYEVTHNYFGGERGLCKNDGFWMRSCTQVCTTYRKSWLSVQLSDTQSLIRIKKLVADGYLKSEKHRPGSGFWFRLSDDINQSAFERCLELMSDSGLAEKPQKISDFDSIAASVTKKLVDEFVSVEFKKMGDA